MMGSRQLEYFRAVARELHFTRAAETLQIAQPALSQQIRKLERQLGITLFERNNHRVELTPAGSALLEHAERILSDIAAVEDEMRGWAEGTRGRIRLGGARGLTARLARLLAEFSGEFPAVDVELREMNTEEMVAGLGGGRLDAATVVRMPPQEEGRRLESLPLGEEPLVLITSVSAPLAGRYRVPVAALDGVDLVCYSPGSVIREIVLSALAAAGATARIRFETREYSTARAMASVGLAAAVVPRSVAEEPGQPVSVVRLEPEPTWAPSLAWPAGRRPSPALAAFIDFAARRPDLASIGP
ncbi:LysR family transcriptional regulator [Actinomadura sp. NPDC048032]|uniref:LysR family transcriptional regulator n=1 Tax=Actinomadura sp. NPDC048032 TaxID=3155747 RepID=UPI0033E545AE